MWMVLARVVSYYLNAFFLSLSHQLHEAVIKCHKCFLLEGDACAMLAHNCKKNKDAFNVAYTRLSLEVKQKNTFCDIELSGHLVVQQRSQKSKEGQR
jgi:hypothetical protein